MLQNNAGDDFAVSADGPFAFPTKVESGTTFSVTIKSQPLAPPQTCTVAGGTGTVATGDVKTVVVNCTTNPTVGGTVSGLRGTGLVLHNNGGDDVVVTANGTFAFPTPLALNTNYAVTVKTQPNGPIQICTIANGTGVIAADVKNVAVTCTTTKYRVGGTVTNLKGSGLVLQNNGGDDLPVTSEGAFAFGTPQDDGTAYAVTIKSQPTGQFCAVAGGFGTVAGGDVTFLFITCHNMFAVGGTVTGLDGAGLVLILSATNTGGESLLINTDGSFTFPPLLDGVSYEVWVANHPSAKIQRCSVINGSGLILGADVTNVTVNCTTSKFPIGGSIKRLASSGLILTINGGEEVSPPSGAWTFTFPTLLESGTSYNVAIKQQPSEGMCVVMGNASGDLMTNNPSVQISCGPSNCAFVDGILNRMWWCKDTQTGRGCNAFCSSMPGFGNPKVSDAAWQAAQGSAAWCEKLATALGYSKITLSSGSSSCAEGDEEENRLVCSYDPQCPARHRNTTSSSNVAVCPCE